jgi:alpha-beta hydrolase superfamily lysophospholipase
MTTENTFTLPSPDGFEIFIYEWAPEGFPPKAIVQIAHGMAEHAARYRRFGERLAAAGYIIYADDHRGHGKSAGTVGKAGLGGEDSWNGMLGDLKRLSDCARSENPDLPLVLFGHSMGSFLAQHYAETWGGDLKALVLSGTTGSLGDDLPGTVAALEGVCQAEGRDGFPTGPGILAAMNAPFEPGRTGFEWLSRDEAEVDKYVADSFCGFAFSNGMMADTFKGLLDVWSPESEAKIPAGLPILIVSGAMDPVGAFGAAVRQLAARYEVAGVQDLTVKLYEGARHELLNETNRDEVEGDIIAWLNAHV